MSKLNAAVVGCGNISSKHINAIIKCENTDLYAVCDIDKAKADSTARANDCKAYYSFDELISDKNVDSVHICTPHYLHHQMVIKAIKAKKAVFCEKPMAISLSEAEDILATIKEYNASYGICFQNRYNLFSKRILELINSGSLGAIKGAKASVYWDRDEGYYRSAEWRGKISTEGGGVLINQAIHTIDLLLWFMNSDITKLSSSISTKRLGDCIEVEDTADIYLEFQNNARAVIFATLCAFGNSPVELDLQFENGQISMRDRLYINRQDKPQEIIEAKQATGDKAYWGDGHMLIIDDFYSCLSSGEHFPVDAQQGIKTMRLLSKVYNK